MDDIYLDKKEAGLVERLEKLKALEDAIKEREKRIKEKECSKKQLILRLPTGLWEDIASWADDDLRSINGQIEFILKNAVRNRKK